MKYIILPLYWLLRLIAASFFVLFLWITFIIVVIVGTIWFLDTKFVHPARAVIFAKPFYTEETMGFKRWSYTTFMDFVNRKKTIHTDYEDFCKNVFHKQ